MGNIQIKELPRRTTQIFSGRIKSQSRSPFKEIILSKSPYYKDFSPIRYSQDSRSLNKSSFKEENRPVSSRIVGQESSRMSKSKGGGAASGRKGEEWSDNRQKCSEIIKKVRNFNDFLLQLKRKLRQDCCWKNGDQSSRGQVSMNVKLQNEKVELEKYKKLVERQLSKTHSIQSISIQNLKNGEKMLTIQYDNTAEIQYPPSKQPIEPFKEIHIAEPPRPQVTPHLEIQNRIESGTKKQFELSVPGVRGVQKQNSDSRLKQIKTTFFFLKQRCRELGVSLSREQAEWSRPSNSKQIIGQCRQKTARIDKLLMELQQTNRQSVQIEKSIRHILL